MKLLGFSFGKSLQSFREGKLIFLTKIMEYNHKLNLIYCNATPIFYLRTYNKTHGIG
jgi:hypothetical protein